MSVHLFLQEWINISQAIHVCAWLAYCWLRNSFQIQAPTATFAEDQRGFVGVSVVEVRHLKHFHRSVFEYSNKRDSQPIITTSMQNDNGQGDVGL